LREGAQSVTNGVSVAESIIAANLRGSMPERAGRFILCYQRGIERAGSQKREGRESAGEALLRDGSWKDGRRKQPPWRRQQAEECDGKSVNPAAAADAGGHGKEQGAKLKAGPRSPLQTSPYQAMAVKALIKPLIDSICFPVIPMLE